MSQSHLDYYTKHGISPVHYMATNIQEHFERRASLYQSLGLTPLTFRGSHVLEVAVGSGQNSLYVASLMPESLTLVEPNSTAINEIRDLYAKTEIPHVLPALVEVALQDYSPSQKVDIVICENWLGKVPEERLLLRRLAGFLSHQGIMVVTAVVPTGFLPNLIRRALSVKYCDPNLSFPDRTKILVEMFEPHLSTIRAMTRSATDWIHDNMMNPAHFDVCQSIPDILGELEGEVIALGTNPSFATDWRWFKELYGSARRFNEEMISEYEASVHNFIDYQLLFSQPDIELNHKLEEYCILFLESVRTYEQAVLAGATDASALATVTRILEEIVDLSRDFPEEVKSGLEAGLRLLLASGKEHQVVAQDSPFSRLFGRETVYLSMMRG